MANMQQPSPLTRHIDTKHFAIIDWVEHDLLIFSEIKTSDNCSDGMMKALAKALHYCHFDTIMGRRIPNHITSLISQVVPSISTSSDVSILQAEGVTGICMYPCLI
jgi:hypothetical protein